MFCTNEATYIQASKVKKYMVGTSKTTYTTTRWLEPVKIHILRRCVCYQ